MITAPRTGYPVTETPESLEWLLEDPYQETNPTGHHAILAADEHGVPLATGEAVLDTWPANAEYVPPALGGRFEAVDTLVRRLRPVFRRDAGLGLGHGLTSLMAALNVWLAGTAEQRSRTAALLLSGGRISVAYHELSHGNDLSRNALQAVPGPDGYTLNGTKDVINNAGRAQAAVVFARTAATGAPAGGRDHSLLLLEDLDALPPTVFRRLPRFRTSGLAGCMLGGFGFSGCPVGYDSLLGAEGEGSAIALKSFQVSRCVTAGVGASLLDGALFGVYRFARERVLYGRPVAAIPHARRLLAGAYADLHIAQALARAGARALHLHPATAGRYAAAVKYLVPRLVEDALSDLTVLLGARSYLREGRYAFVGKHLRDIAGLSIGHAGGVSCQLTVLPELPGLDLTRESAGPALFDDSTLPPLSLAALRLRGGRADPLLATLPAALDHCGGDRELKGLADGLRAELTAVLRAAAELPMTERTVTASARSLALTERYAWLLAAAACCGAHQAAGRPLWLRAMLERIGQRSGRLPESPVAEPAAVLFAELESRAEAGVSFDLDPEPVARRLA